MGAAGAGHVIEPPEWWLKVDVEVPVTRQAMDQLHGPDSYPLGHDEARPESPSLPSAGADTTEHDDCGGIEALVSQLGTELPFEDIWRHVLLVDSHHRHDDSVEVGPAV